MSSIQKDNGALVIQAFKNLRPDSTNHIYDYNNKSVLAQGVSTYPTQEELDSEVLLVVQQVLDNEEKLVNNPPYSLVYKNMWDGNYAGTSKWQELKDIDIDSGIYLIYLDAHTRTDVYYRDPDGGQFGVFFDNLVPDGGLSIDDDSTVSKGGCWTNIADLSETDREDGGERNNGSQLLIIPVSTATKMRFCGRTPDSDRGGITMRMRTTVYKLGEF